MSARSEALNILYRIMHDDGYASLIMRESKIKKEEMASVTNIVYGVLRNYTYTCKSSRRSPSYNCRFSAIIRLLPLCNRYCGI